MKLRTFGIAGLIGGLSGALAACDLPPSSEAEKAEAANQMAAEERRAGAQGKAEEGRMSLKAPGIDIAINVPPAARDQARASIRSPLLPPGSLASGFHIQGDGGNRAAGSDSMEIRFSVERPPAEVAAWYRDPARRELFTVEKAEQQQGALVLSGHNAERGSFSVHLSPRGAGTDGRLVLVDRD